MIKAIRGTRDLLPPDTALWNFVEAAVRDVMRAYNFHEIRTPIFEETQLFARGVGEETDIVSKEMYTWEDRRGFQSEKFAEFDDLMVRAREDPDYKKTLDPGKLVDEYFVREKLKGLS